MRVEVKLPFSYQVVENKIVIPRTHQGIVLDIGYHGVLAQTGSSASSPGHSSEMQRQM